MSGLGLAHWICTLVVGVMLKSSLSLHELKLARAFRLQQSFSVHLFLCLPFQENEQKDEVLLKMKSEILVDLISYSLQTNNCLCKI